MITKGEAWHDSTGGVHPSWEEAAAHELAFKMQEDKPVPMGSMAVQAQVLTWVVQNPDVVQEVLESGKED